MDKKNESINIDYNLKKIEMIFGLPNKDINYNLIK